MIETAPVWSAQNGRTTVRLNFDPAGSVFVIFRQPTDSADHVVAVSGNIAAPGSTTRPMLEIRHAVYTATDGMGEMDVTAKVSELLHNGQPVIASNDLLGATRVGS